MTKEGQLAHITKTFGRSIAAGDEAIAEAMVEYSRGNISRATLAKIKEERRMEEDRPCGYCQVRGSSDQNVCCC